MTAPIIPQVLKTARLTLRRPEARDKAAYVAFHMSERAQYVMGPMPRDQAEAAWARDLDLWARKGFGFYSLDRGTETVGFAGVWQPDGYPAPELGWLIWDGHEGQGYAEEAARAVLRLLRGLGWPAPVSHIHTDNAASEQLATRLGATPETALSDSMTEWRHAYPLTDAPVIRTKRLILRGPEKRDTPALAAMLGDPARMAHLGGVADAPEIAAERALTGGAGHWHWHSSGFFTITDKTTLQPLGRTGVLQHPDWPEPELAWHLFAGAEGQSIAYEAALAARQDAATRLGLTRLVSIIAKANTRSIALAQRLGATAERDHTHGGEDCTIFRHPEVAP